MVQKRPPTSHEVARLAGVSQSAVSRAFTPGSSVSPAMRARIEKAAATLGYKPNLLPRMMLKGRTGIVAVVVGGFYNPFYAMTLESFTRALRQAGRQVMLVQVESDRALDEMVGELAGYRVDAVVSALSVSSAEVAEALSRHQIPVLTLNSAHTTGWVRTVKSDNEAAGRKAAELLKQRGGQRFAYVAGPGDSLSQTEREAGFKTGLATLGIENVIIETGNYGYNGGYAAGLSLLHRTPRPDAIFCANDLTAIGVLDALKIEGKLSCPNDVLVIGYDNIEAASWPGNSLTSFDQCVDDMVKLTIDMLGHTPDEGPQSITVVPKLIERASTAVPNARVKKPR